MVIIKNYQVKNYLKISRNFGKIGINGAEISELTTLPLSKTALVFSFHDVLVISRPAQSTLCVGVIAVNQRYTQYTGAAAAAFCDNTRRPQHSAAQKPAATASLAAPGGAFTVAWLQCCDWQTAGTRPINDYVRQNAERTCALIH